MLIIINIIIYHNADSRCIFVPLNKYITCIMEIRVYLNFDAFKSGATCYVRQIDLVDGISVPFEILLKSMRILYGSACVVDFVVLPNVPKS